MRFGTLLLDTARMSANVAGTPVRLSPLEYRLLNYLAHHAGRPVSAGEIADHLYGLSEQADVNAVEAVVTRLRKKLGAEVIQTRRGFGYLLESGA
jgi:DNA-binding response OmpR family regulator